MRVIVEDFQTLIAAIESGFLKDEIWRDWCERELVKSNPVPNWLIELYDAENNKDALVALYHAMDKADAENGYLDNTSLLLGFLYLRYLAGEFSTKELLLQAGDITDRANYDHPSCEIFYAFLNEYEESYEQQPQVQIGFIARVGALFLKHKNFV